MIGLLMKIKGGATKAPDTIAGLSFTLTFKPKKQINKSYFVKKYH